MMTTMKNGLLVLAALAATACMGTPEDYDGSASSAVSVPADTQPLGRVRTDAWMYVATSCEDRIPAQVEFRIVREGVVVALDARGVPICTDEVEDVQEELIESGRADESRRLGDSYLVSIGVGIPVHRGDPSPQPSVDCVRDATGGTGRVREAPDDEVREGDPSPQPSTQPREECRMEIAPPM